MWVATADMVVYSCYISPSVGFRVDEEYMNKLSRDIRKHNKPVIVAGDFNAKSTEWGSLQNDRRGIIVAEWATQEGLKIENEGDKPTFVRGAQSSHIDLTFCKENGRVTIENWCVLDEETLGCHQLISYLAVRKGGIGRAAKANERIVSRGWHLDEDTLDSFKENLKTRLEAAKTSGRADPEGIVKCVVKASN